MSVTSLVDARGCLTEAGVTALARAEPGKGPSDLMLHVASCARCQTRLLAADEPGPRLRRTAPPLWRTALVFVVMLFALLGLVLMLGRFGG